MSEGTDTRIFVAKMVLLVSDVVNPNSGSQPNVVVLSANAGSMRMGDWNLRRMDKILTTRALWAAIGSRCTEIWPALTKP